MSSSVAAASREVADRQLAAWLHPIPVCGPGFPKDGLIADATSVSVETRWEDADRLTLVVCVPASEAGRVIGREGLVSEQTLGPLARRVGTRLGLRVSLEVVGS